MSLTYKIFIEMQLLRVEMIQDNNITLHSINKTSIKTHHITLIDIRKT